MYCVGNETEIQSQDWKFGKVISTLNIDERGAIISESLNTIYFYNRI